MDDKNLGDANRALVHMKLFPATCLKQMPLPGGKNIFHCISVVLWRRETGQTRRLHIVSAGRKALLAKKDCGKNNHKEIAGRMTGNSQSRKSSLNFSDTRVTQYCLIICTLMFIGGSCGRRRAKLPVLSGSKSSYLRRYDPEKRKSYSFGCDKFSA